MGALRKPVESEPLGQVIHLPIPGGLAERKPREFDVATTFWERVCQFESVDQVVFVVKGLGVAVLVAGYVWAAFLSYQIKNDMGIDLIKGMSFSKTVPLPSTKIPTWQESLAPKS